MANIIKIKRSNTSGHVPSSLVDGEIAINQKDKLLFYRDDAGVIRYINLDNPVPDADATTKGKSKLYTGIGTATDGGMTQAAIKSYAEGNFKKYVYRGVQVGQVIGTVSETEVLKIPIPAGTYSQTDVMRLVFQITKTNGAQTVVRVKFSTDGVLPSGTTNQIATYTAAATTSAALFQRVINITSGLTAISIVLATTSVLNDHALSTNGSVVPFNASVLNYLHISYTQSSAADTSQVFNVELTN